MIGQSMKLDDEEPSNQDKSKNKILEIIGTLSQSDIEAVIRAREEKEKQKIIEQQEKQNDSLGESKVVVPDAAPALSDDDFE